MSSWMGGVFLLQLSSEHIATVLSRELLILHGNNLEELVHLLLGVSLAEVYQGRLDAYSNYNSCIVYSCSFSLPVRRSWQYLAGILPFSMGTRSKKFFMSAAVYLSP